jgi:hypothetical protein
MSQPHHNGWNTSDVWLTPPSVIDALGGPDSFDLDPATPPVQPWPTARARYTEADDGLAQPWFGRVWLNPPYSRPAFSRFMARMADHDQGVALIFARTETREFFGCVWERAAGLLFLRGRLRFLAPDGTVGHANSGAPSVLCAYGADEAERLAFCGLAGQFVPLAVPRFIAGVELEQTWRDLVRAWLDRQGGPVRLDALYRAFARHPKARGNATYQATIRRTLQQGPFERHGGGVWSVAA